MLAGKVEVVRDDVVDGSEVLLLSHRTHPRGVTMATHRLERQPD
jgi:hypothetical protein